MSKLSRLLTLSLRVYFALFGLSTAAILISTLLPANYDLPDNNWHYDKIAHFLLFGMWTFFYGIIRFLKGNFKLLPVFLWGLFFGLVIETLQYILPTNRSAEFLDLTADASGSAFAILLLYLILKNVSHLKPPAHL